MRFEEFRDLAEDVFESIPDDFKEGVDGLEVTRKTVPHPTLPEIYTLGECLSEFYPSEFGGPGEVRSRVVLYYGSFLQLSRTHDDWDWDGEIWETITHEIRHHLEHLALEDDLEEMDYAEDQNFARREGERFDPFFYRSGHVRGDGVFEVDGDLFVERHLRPRGDGGSLEVRVLGRDLRVALPSDAADVHYLRIGIPDIDAKEDRDVFVVLVRKRGFLDLARNLFGAGELRVEETKVEAERV